jgi:hypothetical protein|tara:strand:- start:37 stop:330 length:294 start_codon:yes stop_codon:yes gene_type:complete
MAIQEKIPTPQEVKSTPVRFSEDELSQLTKLRTETDQITFQFGQIQISKIKLEENETLLKKQLADLEKREITLAKSLSDKYGKGSINLDTGTFTPTE